MIAWCALCDGPSECDGRGCITCALIRAKRCESTKAIHAAHKNAGACINGKNHPRPAVKQNGQRYTRCDDCRLVHKHGAGAARRAG